ncbi:MAG: cytochrome b/b6 domain-containing protein [bacterium]|nr:cytochrome b/b6 domain-containing protein [bacterium]
MVAYPIIDRVAVPLYIFSLLVILLHFLGNILSGRFQNRFLKGNFKPITETEYIEAPIRLMHWIHLVCIVGLTFTGLCLRFDWLKPQHMQMKIHHYCLMVVILVNFLVRFWYAFYGKGKTYQDFAFGKKDILNTPAVLKYYLFLEDHYPHIAKYASLQKLSYNLFWIMLIVQGITGFLILWPKFLLAGVATYFGSVELAEQFFTGVHAAIMWFYVIFTTIHAYIACMEGWPLFKLILFNVEPQVVEESA